MHPQAFDMFENGSLLRRRKRFKLQKNDKDLLNEELSALANINRFFLAQNVCEHKVSSVAQTYNGISRTPSPETEPVSQKRSFTIESLIEPDNKTVKRNHELPKLPPNLPPMNSTITPLAPAINLSNEGVPQFLQYPRSSVGHLPYEFTFNPILMTPIVNMPTYFYQSRSYASPAVLAQSIRQQSSNMEASLKTI